MQIEGKIIAVLPLKEGESARGKWQSQEYVVETQKEFPHKVLFSVFGEDKINRFRIREGQTVYVDFDVFAYEYNGKWYNSVRASDVRLREPVQVPTQQEQEPQESEEPTDDLPF